MTEDVASGAPAASATQAAPPAAVLARSLGADFRSEYARVGGTRLHYVAGGTGSPLVLLPGWPQTWWQFRKIRKIDNTGHYLAEEQPGAVITEMRKFLGP